MARGDRDRDVTGFSRRRAQRARDVLPSRGRGLLSCRRLTGPRDPPHQIITSVTETVTHAARSGETGRHLPRRWATAGAEVSR